MFAIGDRVFAGYQGSCDIEGIITFIEDDEYYVEFTTPRGGGCFSFNEMDLCKGCNTPKVDCKCR